MWLAEILVYTAPVSLHPAPGHGQAGPVRINSSPQCTREPVTQCPYSVLLETEIQSKQCTAFTSNPAEVWLVDIKGFVRHVCWQPQPTIFSCPWQCMNASMPPRALWNTSILHCGNTQQSLGILAWIFSPSPKKVHQPHISISHLVFAGSIPTVRDPGPGEQYL